jgi:hypothetical protein
MTPPERVFPSFTPLPFSEARESPDRPVELGLEVLERSVAEGAIGVDDVEVGTLDELDDIRMDEDEEEEAAEEDPGFVVTVDTTTAGLELDAAAEEAGAGRVDVRVVTAAGPGEEELLAAAEVGWAAWDVDVVGPGCAFVVEDCCAAGEELVDAATGAAWLDDEVVGAGLGAWEVDDACASLVAAGMVGALTPGTSEAVVAMVVVKAVVDGLSRVNECGYDYDEAVIMRWMR